MFPQYDIVFISFWSWLHYQIKVTYTGIGNWDISMSLKETLFCPLETLWVPHAHIFPASYRGTLKETYIAINDTNLKSRVWLPKTPVPLGGTSFPAMLLGMTWCFDRGRIKHKILEKQRRLGGEEGNERGWQSELHWKECLVAVTRILIPTADKMKNNIWDEHRGLISSPSIPTNQSL